MSVSAFGVDHGEISKGIGEKAARLIGMKPKSAKYAQAMQSVGGMGSGGVTGGMPRPSGPSAPTRMPRPSGPKAKLPKAPAKAASSSPVLDAADKAQAARMGPMPTYKPIAPNRGETVGRSAAQRSPQSARYRRTGQPDDL